MNYDINKVVKRTCTCCKDRFEITRRDLANRNKTYYKGYCKKESCEEVALEEHGKALDVKREKLFKKAMISVNKARKAEAKQKNYDRKKKNYDLRKEIGGASERNRQHKQPLQKAINAVIRHLDNHKPCFMLPVNSDYVDYEFRGDQDSGKQAGHVIGVGSNDTLRYLTANIFGESRNSNGNQNIGNRERKEGLRRRNGDESVQYLAECLLLNRSIDLSYDEYNEKAALARLILKEMKDKGILYTRREIDERLGIYKLPNWSYEER